MMIYSVWSLPLRARLVACERQVMLFLARSIFATSDVRSRYDRSVRHTTLLASDSEIVVLLNKTVIKLCAEEGI